MKIKICVWVAWLVLIFMTLIFEDMFLFVLFFVISSYLMIDNFKNIKKELK